MELLLCAMIVVALGLDLTIRFGCEARWIGRLAISKRTLTNGLNGVLNLFVYATVGWLASAWHGVHAPMAPSWALDLLALPMAGQVVVLYLALSFARYWIHRAFHGSAVLWKLHRVHHSDPVLSPSTALRHHPLEALLSVILMFPVIGLLAVSEASVLTVIGVMAVMDLATHLPTKARLPMRSVFERLIPTPAFHQLHHDRAMASANSNFSDVFPLWDVVFGTYRDAGEEPMASYGIDEFGDLNVAELFESPFTR